MTGEISGSGNANVMQFKWGSRARRRDRNDRTDSLGGLNENPISYTGGMKTAVSLPDDIFRSAERFARRARKSRSRLYAEALTEYLARHGPDEVTEDMNRVVEQLGGAASDPFIARAARRVAEGIEW
jgi:predicted transcriptional regulator